jgi:hypothetical protein
MASLLLSERAPLNWGLYPELATMVDRRTGRALLQRMLKRGQPHPQQGPCTLQG